MMDQLPIRRCQYCGSDGLNLDWQHGEGIVTFKKHGIPDSQMCCLICRRSRILPIRQVTQVLRC